MKTAQDIYNDPAFGEMWRYSNACLVEVATLKDWKCRSKKMKKARMRARWFVMKGGIPVIAQKWLVDVEPELCPFGKSDEVGLWTIQLCKVRGHYDANFVKLI